jgi:hypothetical protein
MNITYIIQVTDNHLTSLKNQLLQAERIGNLALSAELRKNITDTELALEELRQKPSAQPE